VVSSSKPAGRPTEAAAAADASKLYVTAVMRLGQRTVCSCDDGRKYFRPASITCFKTKRSTRSPLNFDPKFSPRVDNCSIYLLGKL
jgi:hypothetical protein